MPRRIPKEVEKLVSLSGSPIVEVHGSGSGIAFDGEYLYLGDRTNKKIYVYTPNGVLVRTLTVVSYYSDIDYDPLPDAILAVDSTVTGVDIISKTDGSKIGAYTNSYLNFPFTAIAADRYNNKLYLVKYAGIDIHVASMSTLSFITVIHFPFFWSPAVTIPATTLVALDGEDRNKIWVGYKSFPPLMGRIDVENEKVDAYRILGTGFNQGKRSISVRFLNGRWYYWGDFIMNHARLYGLKHMITPVTPYVPPLLPIFDQDIYRWYENDDAETPTPKVIENIRVEEVNINDVLRLRLGISETAGGEIPYFEKLVLQFATSLGGPWSDVGTETDITKEFRFFNGLGEDYSRIANLLLSTTTVKEYFVESSPSEPSLDFRKPDRGEYDFCVQAFNVLPLQNYYLRAKAELTGPLRTYSIHPEVKTATTFPPPSITFSLREHERWPPNDPNFTFTKETATILRMTAVTNPPMGLGYIFIVVPRMWLHGRWIRFRWQGYISASATDTFFVHIMDGAYDRSSDVDFPVGSFIPNKGIGEIQELLAKGSTFAMETRDVQADVDGGTETYCTIFFRIWDGWTTRNYWMQFDWFEINGGPNGSNPLYSTHFTDSVHMERVGTLGDYGYTEAS